MNRRAHRASILLATAAAGHSRSTEATRLCLFLAVEAGGAVVLRHLEQAGAGLLSAPVGAAIVCAAWSFVAHRRLTFRGVTPTTSPAVLAFAPFLAASFVACLLQALGLRLAGDGMLAITTGWGLAMAVKYPLVRAFIWPAARSPAVVRA